ncbi:Sec1-like protein [Filobasidium floriforme]|uniref:Sec1-like protein n=1 Tax=Filobasidium floriforme TaxID=5210 RepID=UPI001E8E4159|nr:Sec1-like protein [Filobasidium floriforme]KAH8089154.1 Sec1-like protein [Filobasidium floriforme]
MPTGLQALLKERISTALLCGSPGTWKVLVVDEHSKALLESVYKLFDILHMNITAVEMLMSPRAAQPSLDVVYLLTPTTQNVNRILADFSDGRRSYKQVHLYFIDGIHDKLAERLTGGLPDDILQSFVELYCNFRALESQVFSIDQPSNFYTLYGNPGGVVASETAQDRFEEDVILTSRAILNILATLGENPYIRYYQPHHHAPLGPLSVSRTPGSLYGGPSAPRGHPDEQQQQQTPRWKQALGGGSSGPTYTGDQIPKRLAMQIQKDLDDYKTLNPEFPPTMNYRPRSVLFVVDRSMDPVAPFLHEFTYQAMINDLLPVQDGTTYTHKVKTGMGVIEERTDILSEEDKIWTQIRHMHMKEAIDKLMADFNKFQQEHAGFRAGENGVGINDMKDMLASLPEFQETRDKFSLHLDMAQECMALFEKRKLTQTADIEQCCATGVTDEGKQPKSIVEEMVPLLADNAVSNKDKVRIIALYILYRDGVPDEDRKRLFQHARLSISEQDTVNNLVYLGCKIVRTPTDRDKRTRVKQKYSRTEDDYHLSRYKPLVKQLIEEQSTNRLDQSSFPYLGEMPVDAGPPPASLRTQGRPAAQSMQSQTGSLRSARPTWHKAPEARQKATTESRQRFIIFVAGGLTYSERRMAYLIGDALNKEVIIGSTHNVTPESFAADLRSLGRSGIGGNPPNAKPLSPYVKLQKSLSGAPPSFQQILDSRIWTEPVGPPALAPPPPPQMTGPTPSTSSKHMSNLIPGRTSSPAPSFNSKLSFKRDKKKDKEEAPTDEKKKKGLFKMRWD